MEEPKNVVEFNLSKCPMCGGEMFVLESRYDAYNDMFWKRLKG